MESNLFTHKKVSIALGSIAVLFLVFGGWYYVQNKNSLTTTTGEEMGVCFGLTGATLLECEQAQGEAKSSEVVTNYVTMPKEEKLVFDCKTLNDPTMVAKCEGEQIYLMLEKEFAKGNMGYCDTAFSSERYGDRAKEYSSECKITYIVNYSKEKDCRVLQEEALVKQCFGKVQYATTTALSKLSPTEQQTIIRQVLKEDNVSLCKGDGYCIDIYNMEVAKKTNNFEFCSNIISKGIKIQCQYAIALYQAISVKQKDPCSRIEQEAMVKVCEEEFLKR